MPKVEQLVQSDSQGLLRNLSEALQHARDGNIGHLLIAYDRKSEGSMTYTYGDDKDMAKLNVLIDIIKGDLVNVLRGEERTYRYFPDEAEEGS